MTFLTGRRRAELEAALIEEETAARIAARVEERVREVMSSEAVQQSLQSRLQLERNVLEEQVQQPSLLAPTLLERHVPA